MKYDILKLHKKEIVKIFRLLCKEQNIKLILVKNKKFAGEYSRDKKDKKYYIKLNITQRKELLPAILFHELGHHYCYKNGLWKIYHSTHALNEQDANRYKRTALKAEKWVDDWGEKECKKLFKNVNYYKPYHQKYGIEYLRQINDNHFKN